MTKAKEFLEEYVDIAFTLPIFKNPSKKELRECWY